MDMNKEIRAEIRVLNRAEKKIRRDLRVLVGAKNREVLRLWALVKRADKQTNHQVILVINQLWALVKRADKQTGRELNRIQKRRSILEGRLA
jgi:hypothetical protein